MIGRLKGELAAKAPGEILVDCGGVGYQAMVSVSTFCRLPEVGERVEVLVTTNMRENALELFAFHDACERELFRLLRSVSGIGPRLALTILSGIEPGELVAVLREGAVSRLVAVPGVGKKTAERLIIELEGRTGDLGEPSDVGPVGAPPLDIENDAVLALVALGYKPNDARKAVDASRDQADATIETLIKRSLTHLSPS